MTQYDKDSGVEVDAPLAENQPVKLFSSDSKILALELLGESPMTALVAEQHFEIIHYQGQTYRVLPPVDSRFPSAKDWHPLHSEEELQQIRLKLHEERAAIQETMTTVKEGSFGLMTFIPDVAIPPMRVCIMDATTLVFTRNRDELKMPVERHETIVL